ncbi:MAG: transcriptional regulator [Actinomycetota bacterium]|nr:transcriptional regulator [Actinomycetota bacterium]
MTLLKALVRERRLTVKETLAVLGRRAERMGESSYALEDRQLRRWLNGDVSSSDGVRPANIRVTEAEFGWPMATLLALDQRLPDHLVPRPEPHEDRKLRTSEFVAWITEHSALSYEAAYAAVAETAARIDSASAITRATGDYARSQVGRARLAGAVTAYYGDPTRFYSARVGGSVVALSILAEPKWVGLAVPLGGEAELCRRGGQDDGLTIRLTDVQTRAAIDRLAAVEISDTVMVNNPLYRLTSFEIGADQLVADFRCTDFAAYALTADLLETELRDLVREGVRDPRGVSTPLRDAWLPTLEAGVAFDRRVCVGGPVCLVAIADEDQYHLLVQERSAQVLNVTGTLAVIPKAFHQPTVDPYGETRISTTLERELEEELLGRLDLEQLSSESLRRAAPLHPLNASAPMEWLHLHRDAWRMECTGFGVNMVSGNYEFSCLVVVHDPTWWTRFGHLLQANWEAMRLHRYSSLDTEGLVHLADDPRWSNEGLFAFIEGLRRLAVLDPARVRVPVTDVIV